MFGLICVEQQVSDPFIQRIQEIHKYPNKKLSRFSYLTNSCTITFEQSFTPAIGRFMSCPCQFIISFRKYR